MTPVIVHTRYVPKSFEWGSEAATNTQRHVGHVVSLTLSCRPAPTDSKLWLNDKDHRAG